ncbi:DUF456 domain-containing protein [Brevibacillus daliensis]|uniref:DUF456 domain-containing protein n=1 Tax=Brevibacillus daliensis TaxID=2892995 RepID=UPI001E63CABB|nr:DUF456 domain-containing protein [Brevibacillus daliensis]
MEFLLWFIVILLFAVSIAGIFFPVLPDTILLWAGFLLYHFVIADPGAGLPASFWWGMGVLTLLMFAADFFTNMYFVKKNGGSRASALGAMIGIILGVILFPPFGMIIFPFVIVLVIEMLLQKQALDKALKIALGTLIGFFSSVVVKIAVQIIMIIWFFVVAL